MKRQTLLPTERKGIYNWYTHPEFHFSYKSHWFRKSCPFSKCGKNLHNTSLIKIHPEEIHYDSSKKKIAELQSELLYWKNCVEKTASFETGDKVTFNTGKTNNLEIGTVKQIMVEIQLVQVINEWVLQMFNCHCCRKMVEVSIIRTLPQHMPHLGEIFCQIS